MNIIKNANAVKKKIEKIGITEDEARTVYAIINSFETQSDLSDFRPEVTQACRHVLGVFSSFKKEAEEFDKMDFTDDKKLAVSYCMIVMLLKTLAYILNLVNENDFKKAVGLFYYLAEETPNLKTSELLK